MQDPFFLISMRFISLLVGKGGIRSSCPSHCLRASAGIFWSSSILWELRQCAGAGAGSCWSLWHSVISWSAYRATARFLLLIYSKRRERKIPPVSWIAVSVFLPYCFCGTSSDLAETNTRMHVTHHSCVSVPHSHLGFIRLKSTIQLQNLRHPPGYLL